MKIRNLITMLLVWGFVNFPVYAETVDEVVDVPVIQESVETAVPVYLEQEIQSLETKSRDKIRPINPAALIFRMFGALAIVIGLLYVGAFMVKRWLLPASRGERRLVNVIDTLYLGPKRVIYLLDVAGEALVVGADGNAMTLLSRLEGKNVDDLYRALEQGGRFSGVMGSFVKEFNSSLDGKGKENRGRENGTEVSFKSSIQDIHAQIQKLKRMKGEL